MSQEQESVLDLSALSFHLLAEHEVVPRARAFVEFVASLLPESAVSVYTLNSDGPSPSWVPRSTIGEATTHEQVISSESRLLGELAQTPTPILHGGSDVRREDYPHVDVRKTLLSISYIPMVTGERLVGAQEILSFGQPEIQRHRVLAPQCP